MRKSDLAHPVFFFELALVPGLTALLAIVLFSPRDALLVGVLLGLLTGLPAGVAATLALSRSKPSQASRPAPVVLLLDEPPVEGEYRELAA